MWPQFTFETIAPHTGGLNPCPITLDEFRFPLEVFPASNDDLEDSSTVCVKRQACRGVRPARGPAMKLILLDLFESRANFYPLALSRPIWQLRVGMNCLADKLLAATGAKEAACFVPTYMAESYRAKTSWPVNDLSSLHAGGMLLLNPRVKARQCSSLMAGPNEVGLDPHGEILYIRLSQPANLPTNSIESFLAAAQRLLPNVTADLATWNYTWDFVLANAETLTDDYRSAGRGGIEGTLEQPVAIRGSANDVYVARGARVHPMAVIDAEHGPVYIDDGAEIHPFTRIQGPCYVGRHSILLGAKCREGTSIGPVCRVGGEVEESILQGHSNKYHDGFLGHAYVGEWVNLGALTTNSDLRNDYGNVSVSLDGTTRIDTGSIKVGSLIGDHTRTSIGTLFNTGAVVGAMCLIAATGRLMPKFLPSFGWYLNGAVTLGRGKEKLYDAAKAAMSRRNIQWTPAEQTMWDAVYEMTADVRNQVIAKSS